jgi:hypothetical protein
MLSEKRIAEFQALYKRHFGEDLSKEEAYEKGVRLIRMVQLVYRPITEKQYQDWQERRKEREKEKSEARYDTNTLSHPEKG